MHYIRNDDRDGDDESPRFVHHVRAAVAGDGTDPLEAFCVRAPHKVLALLKQLLGGSVMVTLTPPHGAAYVTMLWAVDPALDLLSLAADASHPRVHDIVDAGRVTVTAQLDSIKLQFELAGVKLVRGSTGSVFNATMPREMYRFQRRGNLRVAPAAHSLASARMHHPAVAGSPVVLRVLDLSPRGVALALPAHLPPLVAGTRLDGVQLDLDPHHRVLGALQVHHVSLLRPPTRGLRVGCELLSLSDSSVPVMRKYVAAARGRASLPVI